MQHPWAYQEMRQALVWDRRCRQSLATICSRLFDHPQESFSHACGEAARQAAHRIFEHPSSSVAGLLLGHFLQTATRCGEKALVLAVQDSTEFDFSGHKASSDLGSLGHGWTRGLMSHAVLAVSPEGVPLGLLHWHLWSRDPALLGQKHDRRQRPTVNKESQKWITGLVGMEAVLPADQPVLVISDREADVFAYLAAPRRPKTQLLIRASSPRTVLVAGQAPMGTPWQGSLLVAAASAPIVGEKRVGVPRQPGQPPREARLQLRATPAQVQPPTQRQAGEPSLPQEVWLVCATEVEPQDAQHPIQWLLITTLPVLTGETAGEMVAYYSRRWLIERWHYTLKSGCRVERMQFDDAVSVQHGLALYGVVAWRLMWLTHVARTEPEQPAATVLTAEAQEVLERASGGPVETVRAAVRSIARLGGFAGSPSMGEPGVKSLWLGWRRLDAMIEGYRLAFHPSPPMIHG